MCVRERGSSPTIEVKFYKNNNNYNCNRKKEREKEKEKNEQKLTPEWRKRERCEVLKVKGLLFLFSYHHHRPNAKGYFFSFTSFQKTGKKKTRKRRNTKFFLYLTFGKNFFFLFYFFLQHWSSWRWLFLEGKMLDVFLVFLWRWCTRRVRQCDWLTFLDAQLQWENCFSSSLSLPIFLFKL